MFDQCSIGHDLTGDCCGFDPAWLEALVTGEVRLDAETALRMYHTVPLFTLGRWADERCRSLHGDQVRTYVIDRNINYTNVCTARCTFCAFRRDGDEDDAYTLSLEEINGKIAELVAIGGTQILMQGGMNPHLPVKRGRWLALRTRINQRQLITLLLRAKWVEMNETTIWRLALMKYNPPKTLKNLWLI